MVALSCGGSGSSDAPACSGTSCADAGVDAPSVDAESDAWTEARIEALLRTGQVAVWPLDGDGKDHSGNGLDLVINGVSFGAGRFGSGLVFTGDLGKTAMRPMPDALIFPEPGDYTVSVWAQVSGPKESNQGILEMNAPFNWGLDLAERGSGWGVACPTTCSGLGMQLHGVPTDFQHFVIVREGDTMTSWVNGSASGPWPFAPVPPAAPAALRLGSWFDGKGGALTGVVDDIAVWKRALTKREIFFLQAHPVPTAAR